MASPALDELQHSTFDLLPPRPPTPPAPAAAAAAASLPLSTKRTANTQTNNPPSGALLPTPCPTDGPCLSAASATENQGSPRGRGGGKRVEWSVEPVYVEATEHGRGDSPPAPPGTDAPPRRSPPPTNRPLGPESRPIKGILKPSSWPPSGGHVADDLNGQAGIAAAAAAAAPEAAAAPAVAFANMLESITQQLAGGDVITRRDAYDVLARALRASDNLPDRAALRDKTGLLVQFIQRDVRFTAAPTPAAAAAATADGGGQPPLLLADAFFADASLAAAALGLLNVLLQLPSVASAMPHDFVVFTLDHAIRLLENDAVPRVVSRSVMQILYRQNFSAKVMTSDRVGRLITALLGTRPSKTTKVACLQIYRHLIVQCRGPMIAHPAWLLELFVDMAATAKAVRPYAISLGLEAGFGLADDRVFRRKVMDMLEHEHGLDESDEPDDHEHEHEHGRDLPDEQPQPPQPQRKKKYAAFYLEALRGMLQDPDTAASVPQIWSVLVLFLRHAVDRWELYPSLLELIQLSFNSSDMTTKRDANVAWGRFIYVCHLDERLITKHLATLVSPLVSQLRRKKSRVLDDKSLRSSVNAGLCTLFYYLFAPTTTRPSVIDAYWDGALSPVMAALGSGSEEHGRLAMQILTGLFDPAPRLWNGIRVADLTSSIGPDELPAIDPRWLRRNCDRVFAMVRSMMLPRFVHLAWQDSLLHKLWRTLVHSVASTTAKEIKVSLDTATFIGHFLSMASEVWLAGPPPPPQPQKGRDDPAAAAAANFLDAMREFIQTVSGALGPLPLTEKLIHMGQDCRTFTAVSTTPSRRSGKSADTARSPLFHLFALLAIPPPNVPDDEKYLSFLDQTFIPLISARPGDRARELLAIVPAVAAVATAAGPWALIACQIVPTLRDDGSHTLGGSGGGGATDARLGNEYRNVTNLLGRAMTSIPNAPLDIWKSLFDALRDRLTKAYGDAGRAIVLVEPLAKTALEHLESPAGAADSSVCSISGNLLVMITSIFSAATHPRDVQAVNTARLALWGGSVVPDARSADPYDCLYRLGGLVLRRLYSGLGHSGADAADTADAAIGAELAAPLISAIAEFLARCSRQLALRSLSNMQDGIAVWIRDADAQLNSHHTVAASRAVNELMGKACGVLGALDRPGRLPLATVEPLLEAAFLSRHLPIVNAIAHTWNRIFENAEEIEYPECLKAALISVRSRADLLLHMPGLEPWGAEGDPDDIDMSTHGFVDSQDETAADRDGEEVPGLGHRVCVDSATAPYPASSSPVINLELPRPTPDSARIRSRERLGRKSRLRHDDSQLVFVPIAPSSSPGFRSHDDDDEAGAESQHLTDRQKEVRERQKTSEAATLYSDLRRNSTQDQPNPAAGAEEATEAAGRDPQTEPLTTPVIKTTSYAEHGGYDYVNTTPTPRRGRMTVLPLNGGDNYDIPSSPPEAVLRRLRPLISRLSAAAKGRTVTGAVQSWEFSSSPISGSPPPQPDGGGGDGDRDVVPSSVPEEEPPTVLRTISTEANTPPQPAREAAVMTTTPHKKAPALSTPTRAIRSLRGDISTRERGRRSVTPTTRLLRSRRRGDHQQEGTPIPDTRRVIANATDQAGSLTTRNVSARRPGPVAGDTIASPSFEMSDGDEKSLLRLVAELDTSGSSPRKAPLPGPEPHHLPTENEKGKQSGLRSEKKRKRPDYAHEPRRKRTRSSTAEQLPSDQSDSYLSSVPSLSSPPPSSSPLASPPSFRRMKEVAAAAAVATQDNSPGLPVIVKSSLAETSETSEASDASRGAFNSCASEGAACAAANQLRIEYQEAAAAADRPHTPRSADSVAAILDSVVEESVVMEVDGDDDEPAAPVFGSEAPAAAAAEVEPARQEKEGDEGQKQKGAAGPDPSTAAIVAELLRQSLQKLQSATLSRDEMYQLEGMFIDVKRELYQAELRGRGW